MECKIAVVFSISSKFGSELRSGFDLASYAVKNGFNVLVISDIEKNDDIESLERKFNGVKIYKVSSPVKRMKTLYFFNDFLPQIIWHFRVAKFIRKELVSPKIIWIINGAQLWYPINCYIKICKKIFWGPIGGGESFPKSARKTLSFFAIFRDNCRDFIQYLSLRYKVRLIHKNDSCKVNIMVRTNSARHYLSSAFGSEYLLPVIPEILNPLHSRKFTFPAGLRSPRFIWAGQDIPRKNLQFAINLFTDLKVGYFPNASLDVFGVDNKNNISGINFHGWVSNINWDEYSGVGILLISSFREGMPSVLLEALQAGLMCVSTDVGAINEIKCKTLMTISLQHYPNYSPELINQIKDRIANYLVSNDLTLPKVSFEDRLQEFLVLSEAI
jgi:glycosyltransferase involved in cell wall biosynthesis